MASCKDCLHYDVCSFDESCLPDYVNCICYKDRNRFVEFPCKVGSEVFVTPDRGKHFHKATLYGCDEKGTYLVFVNDNKLSEDEKHIVANPILRCFYDWFIKVYTKAEAEQALKSPKKSDS